MKYIDVSVKLFTLQCEYCQCWQHGQCFEFETVEDMPKNYVCEACLYPDNVRSRTPSDLPYDFYKTGKLPRYFFFVKLKHN